MNVRRIRRGYIWLSHRKARANLAIEERFEPTLFLLGCAVALQEAPRDADREQPRRALCERRGLKLVIEP